MKLFLPQLPLHLLFIPFLLSSSQSALAVNYGKAMQHYNDNQNVGMEMIHFAGITVILVAVVAGAIWWMKRKD